MRHHSPLLLARQLPFTSAMILAMLATTVMTNSLAHPFGSELLLRWGFGLDNIRSGYLFPLLISPFLVAQPYMALPISAMLLLFVGSCEYRIGSVRTSLVFWIGQIGGYVIGYLALWGLSVTGVAWAQRLSMQKDVGASNGALSAAGAVAVLLPERLRTPAYWVIVAYLLFELAVETRVWDVEHLVAFHVGIVAGGYYLHRRLRDFPRILPERRQFAAIIAWIVGVTGLISTLGAFLIPHHSGFARIESWLPFATVHLARHSLFAIGIILLLQARGLARRQRNAWRVTFLTLILSLALHSIVGITKVGLILSSIGCATLLIFRRDFFAASQIDTAKGGYKRLSASALFISAYCLFGFYLLRSQFAERVDMGDALREFVSRLLFTGRPVLTAQSRPAAWFVESLPLVVYGSVAYSLTRLLRLPSAPKAQQSQRDLAFGLVSRYGSNTTSYMTLWEGNSLFLGCEGRSLVAYRLNANLAIALGGPVCPDALLARAIREFEEYAAGQGWHHAFYAVASPSLSAYVDAGYETLQIGEEAIIPLNHLEFVGKEWQTTRSAINRAKRTGVVFHMYEGGTVPAEIRRQITLISDEWLRERELPPMEFTLGKTEDIDDPNVNVAVAIDESGSVHAFADWVPVYARHGWVIDLMRRRSDAMSGAMDFVIGMSLMTFKARGYALASLATAPLADLDRDDETTLAPHVLGQIYNRFETYYHFRSLFEFKGKFQPTWQPVYLAYRGAGDIPRIVYSLLKAHLPDLDALMMVRLLGRARAARLSVEE